MKNQYVFCFMASLVLLSGCSSVPLGEGKAPEPEMVDHPYLSLPHPIDYKPSSVDALFTLKDNKGQDSETCSQLIDQVRAKFTSTDQQKSALNEWIRKDPSSCHWFFYSSFKQVESSLSQKEYIDEKQKIALEFYSKMVAIAQAFHEEYSDPRYLYFASLNYQRVSQMVFYRKLETSPEQTLQMTAFSSDSSLKPEKDLETPLLNELKVNELKTSEPLVSEKPSDSSTREPASELPPAPVEEVVEKEVIEKIDIQTQTSSLELE